MIITVDELKKYIATTEDDSALEAQLLALESLVRAYTHNRFLDRGCQRKADIRGGIFVVGALAPFEVGDTVQVSQSERSEGLYTVKSMENGTFAVNEPVKDERAVLVTKVVYPPDVKMGVVNLVKWELNNREKVGVETETISRHSITYFDQSSGNTRMGYPVAMLGFLQPYMCARFGQGVCV